MPNDAGVRRDDVHATAVAIDGRALLIQGASKSGKSRLALALCDASTETRTIELIGDDRVLLVVRPDGTVAARPHPRIAGFSERRGLGLVAMPFRSEAPVAGLVAIEPATTKIAVLQNLPALTLVDGTCATERVCRVLSWWAANSGEAEAPQFLAKTPLTMLATRQD